MILQDPPEGFIRIFALICKLWYHKWQKTTILSRYKVESIFWLTLHSIILILGIAGKTVLYIMFQTNHKNVFSKLFRRTMCKNENLGSFFVKSQLLSKYEINIPSSTNDIIINPQLQHSCKQHMFCNPLYLGKTDHSLLFINVHYLC